MYECSAIHVDSDHLPPSPLDPFLYQGSMAVLMRKKPVCSKDPTRQLMPKCICKKKSSVQKIRDMLYSSIVYIFLRVIPPERLAWDTNTHLNAIHLSAVMLSPHTYHGTATSAFALIYSLF